MRRALLLAAVLVSACGIPAHSPMMLPGEDCLRCHSGERAQQWTLAGTLFSTPTAATDAGLEGASVLVTDANGRSLTLRTNGAGNFYTAESLVFPLHVEVQQNGVSVGMAMAVPSGGCNACHTQPPLNGAPGRIYLP